MKKYKLIKTYPIDIKLGEIAYWGSHGLSGKCYQVKTKENTFRFNKETIENNPEFWQEVVEKDYEILSFKTPNNNSLMVGKTTEGWYTGVLEVGSNDFRNEDWLLKHKYLIKTIKRLSDGEVFTVGDVDAIHGKIKNFYIGTVSEQKNMMFYNECYSISLLNKRKLLFTTEDGVDIFEGDTYYRNSGWIHVYPAVGGIGSRFQFNDKPFSTKEAAEEYVLMNKPCLSINDVKDVMVYSIEVDKLKKLVKSKLK